LQEEAGQDQDKRIGVFIFLFWAHPATYVAGPGFPLVSFLPVAKKDTASIPCASLGRRLTDPRVNADTRI
jgi:hypothetical protein